MSAIPLNYWQPLLTTPGTAGSSHQVKGTLYDYLTTKMQERAGVNMILFGDSLGVVSL